MSEPTRQTTQQPPSYGEDWAFFLDVDGTLLDLAEHPDDVEVRPEIVGTLHDLHELTGGAVALVSGRAIADLDRILLPEHLPAAGQHGLERRDGSGRIERHRIEARGLERARAALAQYAARHPGILLEDKGLVLAVHYRNAPALEGEVCALAERLARDLGAGYKAQHGKMVVEIKPVGHDKGTAIREFLAEPPFRGRRPVFVGDDVTDEDGFRFVNAAGGISVKVGGGETAAAYRLADSRAVLAWLEGYLRHARAV